MPAGLGNGARPGRRPERVRAVHGEDPGDPKLRWSVVQRNFWVHGLDSLLEFLKVSVDYTLKEAASRIRCPTLLGWSDFDWLDKILA